MSVTKLANGNFESSGLVFRMSREGVAVPVNCNVGDLVKAGLPSVASSLHESLDWAQKLSKPGDSFSESLVYFSDSRNILSSMGMRHPRADEYASFVSAGGSYEGWLSLAFRYTGNILTVVIDPDEPFSESRRFVPDEVNSCVKDGAKINLGHFERDLLEFVFGCSLPFLPLELRTAEVFLSRDLNPVMVAGDTPVFRSDQSHSYLSGVRLKDDS